MENVIAFTELTEKKEEKDSFLNETTETFSESDNPKEEKIVSDSVDSVLEEQKENTDSFELSDTKKIDFHQEADDSLNNTQPDEAPLKTKPELSETSVDREGNLIESKESYLNSEENVDNKSQEKKQESKETPLQNDSTEILDESSVDEFRDVLDFMDKQDFLDEDEKKQILKTLDSGEALKLAKLWMTLYPIMFFADIEFTLPVAISIAALAGTPVGIAAGATMTAVQMILSNRIVHWKGEGLEKKENIAKWVMIPKLGKYVPLAYLFKDHKAFVKFLFVFQRIKKIHREKMHFDPNSDEYKEREQKEIEKIEKLHSQFEWIRHQIHFLQTKIKDIGQRVRNVKNKTREAVHTLLKRKNTEDSFDPIATASA